MKRIISMTGRNVKMFFKDKALFFTSLITPMILLVLYATFLSNVYRDSFMQVFSASGFTVSEKIIDGIVGGQLVSSLLAVSCVTVAFCSNMLMVQDKVTGAFGDFCITPVRRSELALSYFAASSFSTLIVTFSATALGMAYLAVTGWYMSVSDVLLFILDVVLITLFGVALSSIVNSFLSSQGQISAVGSIVSSCYGFICGAYMPISSFSDGLATVISFTPGTYATSLLRNHALRGVTEELAGEVPLEIVDSLKEAVDMNIEFLGKTVTVPAMYAVIGGTLLLCIAAYVLITVMREKGRIKTAKFNTGTGIQKRKVN